MVQAKTIYEAFDGTQFETRQEAEEHELTVLMVSQLWKFVESLNYDTEFDNEYGHWVVPVGDIPSFITRHRAAILEILRADPTDDQQAACN